MTFPFESELNRLAEQYVPPHSSQGRKGHVVPDSKAAKPFLAKPLGDLFREELSAALAAEGERKAVAQPSAKARRAKKQVRPTHKAKKKLATGKRAQRPRG